MRSEHCQGGTASGELLFEPTRSILEKRNEAVQWQRPIHEAERPNGFASANLGRYSTPTDFQRIAASCGCTVGSADQPESRGRPVGGGEPAREFGLVGTHGGRDTRTPERVVEAFWCRGGKGIQQIILRCEWICSSTSPFHVVSAESVSPSVRW